MHKSRLIFFGSLFLLAVAGGTVGMSWAEGLDPFDAFYFTIITMGTVGYGDIHPWTTAGKLIAIALVFAGVGTFVGVVETVVESVFAVKEEKSRREKRNMIRGLFFSDVGLELLALFIPGDPALSGLHGKLDVNANWDTKQFRRAKKLLKAHAFALEGSLIDLASVRRLLLAKSDLLLRLLENPSIGEHEAFSDTLRAIYHLRDELMNRPDDLRTLPPSDLKHLSGDMSRAYDYISKQWLAYTLYLKTTYPYLFHLAARTNPFNVNSSAIVRE